MGELGDRISGAEFGQWLAFLEEEPGGSAFASHALGAVLAAMANGPMKKRGAVDSIFTGSDFVGSPWSGFDDDQQAKEPSAPTADELRALAQSLQPTFH